MFDATPGISAPDCGEISNHSNAKPLDDRALIELLITMSTEELEALEDDLDFAHFSGGLTPRIAAMLDHLGKYDQRNAA